MYGEKIDIDKLLTELVYKAGLSSGPGGQNVNKVNTRITLRFDIENSNYLSDRQKTILKIKLKNKVTNLGELIINSQHERSQLLNKEYATNKFISLVIISLTPNKKRKPTKRTKASVENRLSFKRRRAEQKKLRSKTF